jgi:hypothetical protein
VSAERLSTTRLPALAITQLRTRAAFNLFRPCEAGGEIEQQRFCRATELRGLIAHATQRVDVIPRVHISK